jgi:hypothetical protein
MRNRFWTELCQAKHNSRYCVLLLAYRRKVVNFFSIIILAFSSAGIMGWPFWKELPLISCVIISLVQLLRVLQPHLVPNDRQLDKLESVTDFYCEYYNKLESLWFDFENDRKNEEEVQIAFYALKDSEKPVNKIVGEIVKSSSNKLKSICDKEVREYLSSVFN